MLFDQDYIDEVRSRLFSGDVDRIELDLLDALDCIEELKADLERYEYSISS